MRRARGTDPDAHEAVHPAEAEARVRVGLADLLEDDRRERHDDGSDGDERTRDDEDLLDKEIT